MKDKERQRDQEFKVIPLRYIASPRYQGISVITMRVMMTMNIDHDVVVVAVDDDDDVQFQSDYMFGSHPPTQTCLSLLLSPLYR